MTLNTLERARYRWREILPQLGVETRFLVNKHGPCPICRRGKDRFRFDDRDGSGSYICSQCGAGSGIILIRNLKGWTHKEACDEIDKILGDAQPLEQPSPVQNGDPGRRLRAIERALAEARSPQIVDSYLTRRGLRASSAVLRGDAHCPYFNDDRQLVGRYPALVAPIIGPDGSLQSVHRIYDANVDPRKKTLPPVNTIGGAAVRLQEPDEELGIGEGIENSLAAHELFGVPVWAALTANGIRSFQPPPGLLRLHIFADNDANYVGQEAAFHLAKRVNRDGLTVEVHVPPVADTDWLDVLESDAFGSLGINAFRLLRFLMVEHMRQGAKRNGFLMAPQRQLYEFGIGAHFVTAAIEEVEQSGLVDCQRGVGRRPSYYTLTWLPMADGRAPSNRWRSVVPAVSTPSVVPAVSTQNACQTAGTRPVATAKQQAQGRKSIPAKQQAPSRSSYQGGGISKEEEGRGSVEAEGVGAVEGEAPAASPAASPGKTDPATGVWKITL